MSGSGAEEDHQEVLAGGTQVNDEDIKGVKPILHEWPTAHGLIRIVRVPGATWISCETLDVDAGQWRACHPMEFMLTEEIVDLKKEIAVLRAGIDAWHQEADDRAREIIQQAAEIAALRERLALVVEYAAPNDCYIRAMRQPDETKKWKVISRWGGVLNKRGEWEYEPLPSYRDDAYYERCRFDTAEEARQVLEGRALEEKR